MTRIAIIGAGSVVFLRNLLTCLLTLPERRDGAITLHDIAPEHLDTAARMARAVAQQLDSAPTVTAHADRCAALDGADFVINMVQIGMHAATLLGFDIPRRHGLKQTIADTVGRGGIFRGLRTIAFMLDLVRDMRGLPQRLADERHQPNEHPHLGGIRCVSGTAHGRPMPQRAEHRARTGGVSGRRTRPPVL
ncbi:MAG TPA: hypothetical protein VK726_02755 [Acetobacteraceae bacterium]|jgi:alpha-galactosidase|nr:hypothetical protein [Acetobacteraceae bacterium]